MDKEATEIIPNLWIGNDRAALSTPFLEKNNIKFIINTSDAPNFYEKKIKYLKISILEKKVCYLDISSQFDQFADFILEGLKNKKGVLIESKDGKNISASIAIVFLIKYLNIDYLSAIIYINSRKQFALTNNTCMTKAVFKYYLKHSQVLCKHSKCNCKKCK